MNALPTDTDPPYGTEVDIRVRADHEPGKILVWARYAASAAKRELDQQVWDVTLECVASFETATEPRNFSEHELYAFAVVVGAPILHPFARDYLQSLTSKSAYPAFTIGLLDPVSNLPPDDEIEISGLDGDEPV